MNQRSIFDLVSAEKELQDKWNPDRLFDVSNQFLPYLSARKSIDWLQNYIRAREGLGVTVRKYTYLTVSSIHSEVAELLKKAGVDEVYLGIEHFSEAPLRTMNKPHKNRAQLENTLSLLHSNEIRFRSGVVVGDSRETERSLRDIEDGLRWMKDGYSEIMGPVGVYPIVLLPGSKAYSRIRQQSQFAKWVNKLENEAGFLTPDDQLEMTRAYINSTGGVSADRIFEACKTFKQIIPQAYDYVDGRI